MTRPRHDPDLVRGAMALPVNDAASRQLFAGDMRLIGWSLVEATGAGPAQVDLVDGQAGSGNVLGVISLQAGAVATVTLGTRGVQVNSQLSLQVNSGQVRGAVYVIDN